MAIYHCEINTGTRAGGKSAGAKADYIQREGKYQPAEKELLHKESGNMPEWAKDAPSKYWHAADTYERANGRLYKEVEFALPRELSLQQNRQLAQEFARNLTDKETLPYTMAIHAGKGTNPHCHLIISERKNDGIDRSDDRWFKRYNANEPELKGGAQKTTSLMPRQWFDDTVRQWAEFANRHLEKAGHEVRIDHRSLAEQGIERLPGVHLGPNVVEMEKRGIQTERGQQFLDIVKDNAKIIEHEGQKHMINTQIQKAKEQQHAYSRGNIDKGPQGLQSGRGCGRFRSEDSRDKTGNGRNRERDGRNTVRNEKLRRTDDFVDRNNAHKHGKTERVDGRIAARSGQGNGEMAKNYQRSERSMEGVGLEKSSHVRGNNHITKHHTGAADHTILAAKDRTYDAVSRQLKAMGCERYEVGIREAKTGKMMNREWSADEVKKAVPWLKRENATGKDIYIRPAKDTGHGLVLVDDIDKSTISQMKENGHSPALAVETSPGNYQAWVKVGDRLPDEYRKECARHFVQEYGADRGSADAHHYGRLGGFTNQKEQHMDKYGRQPWVLVRDSNGKVAPAGKELVHAAGKSIEHQNEKQRQVKAQAKERSLEFRGLRKPDAFYKSQMQSLSRRFDDKSRCDFIAAKNMAMEGYSRREISDAMRNNSPDIEQRKGRNADQYVDRTVGKAMDLPEVKEARIELAHDRSMDFGYER